MANGDDEDLIPRQEYEFSITTVEQGKITLKLLDRINVDDVFLHLVNQEIYGIITKTTVEQNVKTLFKDFLLQERFTAGQN